MLESFKLLVIGLKISKNLTSIAKSLESLAESQRLHLKLQMIAHEIDLDTLRDANWGTPEEGETQIVFDTDKDLKRILDAEASFLSRFGVDPPRSMTVEQIEAALEEA